MVRILARSLTWSALGAVIGTVVWTVLTALVQPVLNGRWDLSRALEAFPVVSVYAGSFAAATGAMLLVPYALAFAAYDWHRARRGAPRLTVPRIVGVGLAFGAPAALGVAYSFAYGFSPGDVRWDTFFGVLPSALITFWAAAALPLLLVPPLRAPVRTGARAAGPG